MGVGPIYAIPLALKTAGLQAVDIDLFEVKQTMIKGHYQLPDQHPQINEAFASQCVYCVKKLGLPS